MAKQLGRISGPLLQENLLRNGSNLEFSNDRTVPNSTVLFLDVNNNRIGINSRTPPLGKDLYVNGTVQTNNIISTSDATIADFDISNGQIQNFATPDINITSANSINVPALKTANIFINDNNIETYTANTDLTIEAFAGKNIIFETDTVIDNDLSISGSTFLQDLNAINILFNNITANGITVNRNAQFENIKISQNIISTSESNSNIDLSPAGTGTVEIYANTNVNGNVHATGNITFSANTVLGDQDTDSIVINADVTSNIVPVSSSAYNLGSELRQWSGIKSSSLNVLDIDTAAVTIDGIDITNPQGNVFYVAVNGNNANKGDHQQNPWASLKYALEQADASFGGPVTIYLYPGEYEEELPLYVPPNVTVRGSDLRNCIVKPDSSSQSEDVFLLDGESTIEDLTIKDFYYDNVNDKGYAFRFAEVSSTKTVVTRRSPYIRNVTVITQGSVTSASDPRGFDAGDAGRGALIDGQYVDSSSNDASMLFHSCTFITPNAVAITMRNGVRVEWLNCFTYFADIGLYAINGALGRLTSDGSTVRKGAEIRSIGSANVYGNYGAIADGDETLMYLIGHNFAYTGTGKDVSNDTTLVINENQTVERNNGRIYYTKTNERGNYEVGDSFFVNFDTGITSLTGAGVDLVGLSSITINTAGNQTFINAEKIETGNWRIEDNTISALIGDGNLAAASGTINFTNDVNMQSNLSMTGNFTMSGANFTLGNAVGDSVSFEADVDSNIIPKLGNVFTLGSATKKWNYVYLSNIPIDEIEINDNYIQTVNSNADLELRANSTGNILFTSSTQVNNDLTVDGIVNLTDSVLTTVTHVGNLTHTGNKTQTGDKTVSGQFNVSTTANFDSVQINTNYITSTVLNSDLELRANGTGEVIVPTNNVEITNDLYVSQGTTIANAIVTSSVDFEELVVDDLKILDNRILTTTADTDLILNPNGIGSVQITENNLEIDNNFTVIGSTELLTTNAVGTITHIGTHSIQGDIAQSGTTTITGNISTGSYAQFEDVLFSGNFISTTTSNSDLDLRASGTGVVRFTEDTTIPNNLQINGTLNTASINTPTSLDLNEIVVNNNLEIDDNFITTAISNSNLELRATTGELVNIQDSATIENNSTINGTTNVQNINLTGLLTLLGNINQQGHSAVTGNYNVTGSISTEAAVQFENILISGNSIKTTILNSDLELRANGTGVVRFNNDTQLDNNLTVQGNITAGNIVIDTNLDLDQLITPSNILIDDNYITTTETNSNLELRAHGTGFVEFQDVQFKNNSITTLSTNLEFVPTSILDINTTGAINLPAGTYAERTSTQGDIRYNSEFFLFHGYATSNVAFNGVYSDNFLTRVRVNDTDNVLRFDVNNTEIATITDSVNLLRLDVDDVSVDNNVLSTNALNSNLQFSADGTGEIVIDNIKFGTNTITNTAGGALLITATDPDTYFKIGGTYGIVITANSTSNRRTNPELAEIRFNTSRNTSEIWNGTEWASAAGETGTGTSAEIMAEILDEFILIFG